MIQSFKSKPLKRYWEENDSSGIRPDWVIKVRLLLSRLDVSEKPQDMRFPGSGFHPLLGDRLGTYAVTVSRNWRIRFEWSETNASNVGLEDYHGN